MSCGCFAGDRKRLRYRTRPDDNQKEIDAALRSVGATVLCLGDVGNGCPDRLIGFRGENILLETKNKTTGKSLSRAIKDRGQLNDGQVKFHESWRGRKPVVVFDVDEALVAIGAKSQANPCGRT